MKQTHSKKLYIFPTKSLAFILAIILFLTISPAMEIHAKNIPVLQTTSISTNITKKACWISFLDVEVLLQDKKEKILPRKFLKCMTKSRVMV